MPDSNEDQKRLDTLLKNVNPAIRLTRKLKKDEDYDKVPEESREQAVARIAEARARPPPRFNLEEGGKKKKRKTRKKNKRKGGKKAEDLPPRRQNPRRTSPSQLSREQLRNIRREAREGLRRRLDFDSSQAPPPPMEVTSEDSYSATSSPPALQGTAPTANVVRPVAQRRPTEDHEDEEEDEHPKPIRGGKRKTKKRRRKKGGNDDDDDESKTLAHVNVMKQRALAKFREPFEDTPAFEQRLVQAFKAEGLNEAQAQEAKQMYMFQHSTPATAAQRMRAAMARRSGGKKKRKTNRRKRKKGGDDDKEKTRKKKMKDFKVNLADYNKTVRDSKNPMPPRTRPSWASPTASGWAVAPYDRSQDFIPPAPPLPDLKGGRKKRRRKTRKRKAGMDRKEEVKSVLKEWKPVEGKGSLPDIPADKIATEVKETEYKEFQELLREIAEREAEEEEERRIEEDIRRRGRYGELW